MQWKSPKSPKSPETKEIIGNHEGKACKPIFIQHAFLGGFARLGYGNHWKSPNHLN
jgi:hypothetical protein